MTSAAINKHSFTRGATPNLVPGSIGVNKLDEVLFLRAEGRVASISLTKWQSGLAPRDGAQDGAPLMMHFDGPTWEPLLAPSSVINGRIQVDAPPVPGEYGIPSVQITGFDGDVTLTANTVIAERFYVASDQIRLERIAVKVAAHPTSAPISIGVADDTGQVRGLGTINTPSLTGLSTANFSTTLLRGWYQFVLWTKELITITPVAGVATDQGWSLDGSQNPAFIYRLQGNADLSVNFDLAAANLLPLTRPDPAATKLLIASWVVD